MAGRLEVAGRRLLTEIVHLLLPPRGEDAYRWFEEKPDRVLLVRHDDRIGNLILMKPLLQGVRDVWPETEIGVLIGPRYAQVFQEEPEVDMFWILEKRRILRNPFIFFSFLRALRKHSYDLAFDCSHMHSFSLTGAAMTYLSGAPVRVAYDRDRASSFCNLLVEQLQAEHHESEILLNLLRPFVEELPPAEMELHLSEQETIGTKELLAPYIKESEVVVGVHIGGRGAKKWPLQQFEFLIERILELYKVSIAVLCGPGEEEEAEDLRDRFGTRIAIFDDLDLREMLSFVASCDFFICPDTGPMHAAVAFGVPTVAVFLEETYRRYGPRGEMHRIVRTDPQSGSDEVLEAFAQLVSERFQKDSPSESGVSGDRESADTQ